MMATEAIKLLVGIGQPLVNRLVLYDALRMHFHELKVTRDGSCPACGHNPEITELIEDYDGWYEKYWLDCAEDGVAAD